MPPPQRMPSSSSRKRRQPSRSLLTPPLPSLDSVLVNLSSSVPPTFYYPLSYLPHQEGGNPYNNDSLLSDQPGLCGGLKADVWLGAQSLSSPPSPATIDSTTDSQPGGDYFPPSESVNGDSPHDRRTNLSLNFSALPPNLQLGAGISPASVVSASAPFTTDNSHADEYFHLTDAAMSASTKALADQANATAQQHVAAVTAAAAAAAGQVQPQHTLQPLPPTPLTAPSTSGTFSTYRLPASQPSSPVRGVFMSGQQSMSMTSGGRQRGATISGIPAFEFGHGSMAGVPTVTTPLAPLSVSAVPAHFAFSMTPNMSTHASPVITPVATSDLSLNATGMGMDVTMEDASASQTSQLSRRSSTSQHSAAVGPASAVASVASQPVTNSGPPSRQASNDTRDAVERLTLERLTMLDTIVIQAQTARAALLRGQEDRLPEALGQISNQLDIASDLGVAPTATPRETTPGSGSQSLSPLYSPTPVNPPAPPPSALLPSLPVSHTVDYVTQPNPTPNAMQGGFMPSQMAFTNGTGQLAPQMPSTMPTAMPSTMPSTPINQGANTYPPNMQHMPMVSSPLAVVPPASRGGSPKPYGTWLPEAAMVAVANGPMAHAQAQALVAHAQAQAQAQAVQVAHAQHAQQAQAQAHAQETAKSRRSSIVEQRADGRPIVRGRSSSVAKPASALALTPSVSMPPSAWQSRAGSPIDDDDDDDDEEDDDTQARRPKRRRSSAGPDSGDGPSAASISEEIRKQLDQIFHEFLNKVCSDLDICDSKGEKLHQVLMPKKMARLDECPDFRPFKFRIQAFTNAFHEELQARGITEETMSVKKVKVYLWHQELISRFNADGKKAKSKGNHIWHVDAKKLPGGGWTFRAFKRKIIGQPPTFAVINGRYEWEPKIWDPMAASASIKPVFSSPEGTLPPWLMWEDGVRLAGIPDREQPPVHITAQAKFVDGAGQDAIVETSFSLQVIRMPATLDGGVPYIPQQVVQQWMPPMGPEGQMDLATLQAAHAVQAAQAAHVQSIQGVPQGVPVQAVPLGYPPQMQMYPQTGFGV